MLNKEVKQNPALMAMLGVNDNNDETKESKEKVEKKAKKDPRKANPKGYVRNRGRDGTIPMSYYIPKDLIRLLNIKAAKDGKTKSELVVEGLRYILKDEIREMNKEIKEKKEEVV